jgi:beta-mannosidase
VLRSRPVSKRTPLHSGWEVVCSRWTEPPARLGYSHLEWLPAEVPGHVHLDLVKAGVIAHPFESMHELGSQWIDEERWSYRTTLDLGPRPERTRRVLRFDGLDTVATVSLDGKKLADHDDMFVPLEVDLGEVPAGKHELRVDFESATRVGRERRARYFAAEGLPENLTRFDERAFVQKAGYMYGWDWGPRLVSAGIWQPVWLLEHEARLLDVHVGQRHLENGTVELSFASSIEGQGAVVHFVGDASDAVADGTSTVVVRPELWWPAGMGAPALLPITSYLVPERVRTRAEAERSVLDRRVTRIGLRRIRLVREADRHGQSFELEVNGKRFYAVGANWIPDHSFPSKVTRAVIERQVARARDMNMNMLRVWGGGLYETDDFYDVCDEAGVLVWQDFPFACQYYPEDERTLAAVRRQARENVRRLRRHPSLALWCGNNENLTMFESGWDDPKRHPPRYYGEKLYEGVLPEVLRELDPERPYIPTSPWGGTKSNDGGIGDQHYWDVWHGRGDWKHYDDSTARFCSEFGFASAPGHAALTGMLPGVTEPLSLDFRDRRVRFHDKTFKGYETFVGFVELHYPVAKNLEEWTYFSQLNQRDALRHGIEHFRRSEFCRGALVWQLNDCWPVQSWAVIDSSGDYKAAAYELRRLFARAVGSLVVRDGRATLTCLLDNTPEPLSGTAVLEVRSLIDGRVRGRGEAAVTLAPEERREVLTLDIASHLAEETIVVATFAGTQTFRLLAEPKAAKVQTPRLTATLSRGALTLTSDVPVVDLFLSDPAGKARFLDNFVTLPAGGTTTLRVEGDARHLAARSLAGAHPVELRGR